MKSVGQCIIAHLGSTTCEYYKTLGAAVWTSASHCSGEQCSEHGQPHLAGAHPTSLLRHWNQFWCLFIVDVWKQAGDQTTAGGTNLNIGHSCDRAVRPHGISCFAPLKIKPDHWSPMTGYLGGILACKGIFFQEKIDVWVRLDYPVSIGFEYGRIFRVRYWLRASRLSNRHVVSGTNALISLLGQITGAGQANANSPFHFLHRHQTTVSSCAWVLLVGAHADWTTARGWRGAIYAEDPRRLDSCKTRLGPTSPRE